MILPRRAPLPYNVERFLKQTAAQTMTPLTAAEAQRLLDRYESVDNLSKAAEIIAEIDECVRVQKALKDAFRNDQLDGGWQAALEHPLYLQAEGRIALLQSQLKELI